ncbi:OmpA/MotB family protein [Psychroflexus planctonicus]|uniref:Cell envelope biogenesis protein OmpA n=1 Tax=Psychroflexus planctonicus TaxID=1526575 RepID=A0ABQ1SF95_9FLAO|nr:OmpA family protein [Psychroflexus planctonicus]GGE35252.1 cell envelope biogenesis protein OmpA [Psychroflexus planctonicus]
MKIIRLFIAIVLPVVLLTSCVSQKKFKDLEGNYNRLVDDYQELKDNHNDTKAELSDVKSKLANLESEYNQLKEKEEELRMEYANMQTNYLNLSKSYDALEKNSSSALAENSKRNRELLKELEEKEKTLAEEQTRLEKLQKDLASRSERIDELEGLIADKEQKMNNLRENLSKALTNFEGKGLSVEQRDGKVYVSMENKLLFSSGSWSVGSEGKKAVTELGKVLAQNPDIAVSIEGHTDDDPYRGTGQLTDNWDLSTKRATEVLKLLLKNNNIDPQNLTAAGKGEHAPVASNETAEGKAKNRRIEVVLTPKLDEISNMLNEM